MSWAHRHHGNTYAGGAVRARETETEGQSASGRNSLKRITNQHDLSNRVRSPHSAAGVQKGPLRDATFSTDAPESSVFLSGSPMDEQDPRVSAANMSAPTVASTLELLMQERSKLLMRISSKLGVGADTVGPAAVQLGTPRAALEPLVTVDQCDSTYASEFRSPSTFLPSSPAALQSQSATAKQFVKADATHLTAAEESRSDLRSLHATLEEGIMMKRSLLHRLQRL